LAWMANLMIVFLSESPPAFLHSVIDRDRNHILATGTLTKSEPRPR
jgi:hypothetical protein